MLMRDWRWMRDAPINSLLRHEIEWTVRSAHIGIVVRRENEIEAVINCVDHATLEEIGMGEMSPKKLNEPLVVAAPVDVAVSEGFVRKTPNRADELPLHGRCLTGCWHQIRPQSAMLRSPIIRACLIVVHLRETVPTGEHQNSTTGAGAESAKPRTGPPRPRMFAAVSSLGDVWLR